MRKHFLLSFSLIWLLTISLRAQYAPINSPQFSMQQSAPVVECPYIFMLGFRMQPPFALLRTNMLVSPTEGLVWYQQAPTYAMAFELHENGLMAYNDAAYWHILDSNFAEVDSIVCRGARNDFHDLRMLANGHYLMFCLEDSIADLSSLRSTSGAYGSVNGRVESAVVQELDANGQLIKSWHAWDHFWIQDPDSLYFENPAVLELTHSNSIDWNGQGKMLLSHKVLDAVTQIDWNSGQVDWQLGGRGNQFDQGNAVTMLGQHDARYLPNGQISVFDNGNHAHDLRGLIYNLDTVAMTASIAQSYEMPGLSSDAMGGLRIQTSGEAILATGRMEPFLGQAVTIYDNSGNRIWELSFLDSSATYRAICADLPFTLKRPRLTCEMLAGQVILGLEDTYAMYEWTSGAQSANIVVADTGTYQVFVPKGVGMMSSIPYHITDLANACLALESRDAVLNTIAPNKLLGLFDLLGRPILQPIRGQVYIVRYQNGQSKRLLWLQ